MDEQTWLLAIRAPDGFEATLTAIDVDEARDLEAMVTKAGWQCVLSAPDGDVHEAGDDHFYGAWQGGTKTAGGHAAAPGSAAEFLQQFRQKDRDTAQAAIDARAADLARGAPADREVATVLGPDGKPRTVTATGDLNSVDLPPGDYSGCHVIHTHPNGSPLSDSDLLSASYNDLGSITAVGTDIAGNRLVYTMHRPDGGWPSQTYLHQLQVGETRSLSSWKSRLCDRLRSRQYASHAEFEKEWEMASWRYGERRLERLAEHPAFDSSLAPYRKGTWS